MFLDNSLLVNQQKLEGIEKDITCPICKGILNDPYFCIKCQNNFCYKCINKYKLTNKKCPFRCENTNYIKNIFLNKIFPELLKFKCEKGCDEIIPYKEVNTHNKNCKKEDFKEKYFESATQVEILKIQIEDYKVMENELENIQNGKRDFISKLINELNIDEEFEDDDYEYEILEKIRDYKVMKNGIENEKNDFISKLINELNLDEVGDYDYEYEILEKIRDLKNDIENLREENKKLKIDKEIMQTLRIKNKKISSTNSNFKNNQK